MGVPSDHDHDARSLFLDHAVALHGLRNGLSAALNGRGETLRLLAAEIASACADAQMSPLWSQAPDGAKNSALTPPLRDAADAAPVAPTGPQLPAG